MTPPGVGSEQATWRSVFPSSTMTSIGRAFEALAVYVSTAANCGRFVASSLTCCPMMGLPVMGSTVSDCEPVQPLQPVC